MSDNQHPTYLFQEVAAIKDGTLCTVTHYAVDRNGDAESNSIHLRLFCDWMPLSVMSVYANEFWRLPQEWKPVIDDALATGKSLRPKRTGIKDREDAKERGLLKPLPMAADIVRYQFDADSTDQNQKRWRFYAIYRLFKWTEKTETKVEQNAEKPKTDTPHLESQGDCWQWSIDVGAFPDMVEAKAAYNNVKKEVNPTSATQMYTAWIAHVNKIKPKN